MALPQKGRNSWFYFCKPTVFPGIDFYYNVARTYERGGHRQMTIEQRIRNCLLIEKMREQKTYSRKLGLENISKFRGRRIYTEEENEV